MRVRATDYLQAEWEYAYRAGSTTAFYSGGIQSGDTDATLDVIGWYFSNATGSTYPVMQKEPNAGTSTI